MVDGEQADPGPVDAVVVGLHLTFDYARLDVAARAARDGARLIATNDDATYPGEHGLSPGAGSLLAAVVTASGATPVVAGKPYAAHGGPGARPRRARRAWPWATGPTPTGASPGRWATGSAWC